MRRFADGYIPDEIQAEKAAKAGKVSHRDLLLSHAAPWDATDQPPVTTWDSFAEYLTTAPEGDSFFEWWRNCRYSETFYASQQSQPNCAGFALANATTATLIHQIATKYSEQRLERLNPMATWVISKNGSTRGGQTISAICMAGNKYGNFTDTVAGRYNEQNRYYEWTKHIEEAKQRQVGICLFEGTRDELGEAIVLAMRLGHGVVIGNYNAVSGTRQDENGMFVATLGGRWAHATAFAGYRKVNGTEYVFWINSHGNIYDGNKTPRFGAWMDRDTLERFVNSVYCDVAFITYAEAPYISDAPTLSIGE